MRRWIAFPLIVVCLATTTGAFAQEECDGPFNGKKPTEKQLAEVLAIHRAWINSGFPTGDERRANFCKANLSGADLSGAFVDLEQWPNPEDLLGTDGLAEIQFASVKRIVAIRKELKDAGFQNQTRALTSALKNYQLGQAPAAELIIQGYILGGVLTDFGANPLGTLLWLPVATLVFFWLYLIAIFKGNEKAGIWKDRPDDRLLKLPLEKDHELIVYDANWKRRKLRGLPLVVGFPMYFSLLSTFHFGWRQLNVGNWLVRLQQREYTLRATGWVRTVAGFQSLISLYLVALALLTYFGDLFA